MPLLMRHSLLIPSQYRLASSLSADVSLRLLFSIATGLVAGVAILQALHPLLNLSLLLPLVKSTTLVMERCRCSQSMAPSWRQPPIAMW